MNEKQLSVNIPMNLVVEANLEGNSEKSDAGKSSKLKEAVKKALGIEKISGKLTVKVDGNVSIEFVGFDSEQATKILTAGSDVFTASVASVMPKQA